jgi:hypothetical protein
MSEADLNMLELRIVQLAEEADAEKRKHAERLRIYRTKALAILSSLETVLSEAQKLYELLDSNLEEALG